MKQIIFNDNKGIDWKSIIKLWNYWTLGLQWLESQTSLSERIMRWGLS